MHAFLAKASILSISLLTVMASAAISPALAKISQAFPGVDKTLIKLVLTLPSLLIIPFSILAGQLVRKMRKKTILFIGLVIYFLGGVGGAFAQTITQLLVVRAFFGIGVGLIIPLSTSLIADFYQGPQRAKMMGLSGSVSHLGGVIFLLVSGWVACISWRYAFGVYGLSLIIFLMVLFWLPEQPSQKAAGPVKAKLPPGVYWCAFLGALMMVAFYAAPTNLALFIESERPMYTSTVPLFADRAELEACLAAGTVSSVTRDIFARNNIVLSPAASLEALEPNKTWSIVDRRKRFIVRKEEKGLVVASERLGRPGISGMFLSTMTFTGIISGIILAALIRIFGLFSPALGIGAMAAGYALLGNAKSLPPVFLAMLCIGFSSGVLMPMLLLQVAKLAPDMSRAMAMAIASVGVYFGQFISPVVLKWVTELSGPGDAFRQQFNFLALGLGIATVLAVISAFIDMSRGVKADAAGVVKH